MPRLTCDISQSLWDALHRAARENGETIAHAVSRALADSLQVEHGTLFQVSTSGALVQGVLDGAVSVATLREHGNFGLGTFVDLDGEMIVLDGQFYQIRSDGSVRIAEDNQLAPFAVVTHFNPERVTHMQPFATLAELTAQLDRLRTSENLFFAARLSGTFRHVHNRAACKVGPHETLADAAEHQGEFHTDMVRGTMVGFWTPSYVKALGVAGWHLHFMSDDHRAGGHVLGAAGEDIEVAIEHLDDFRIAIPETAAFLASDLSLDSSAVLDRAEKARS
ncbi:MAG TPA: acetolactate decarboxylase [Acidisoma sp.]|uniref:acetolactate decarboxylase n=1 Tax=Acidisoma sp. TaxID=1872115 RepID=UPI002CA65083|nr:acetolactate decarboxylase [Acidisoma sp.]HTI00474.1 acetolactate decarboxylase [Acidisoma sp.]